MMKCLMLDANFVRSGQRLRSQEIKHWLEPTCPAFHQAREVAGQRAAGEGKEPGSPNSKPPAATRGAPLIQVNVCR
jgi:hypothetical protein